MVQALGCKNGDSVGRGGPLSHCVLHGYRAFFFSLRVFNCLCQSSPCGLSGTPLRKKKARKGGKGGSVCAGGVA